MCSLLFCAGPSLAAPGDLDPSFGGDGTRTTDFGGEDRASDVVVQPDGKAVVGGWSQTSAGYVFALVRYNPDGSLDSSFGGGKVTTDVEPGQFTFDAIQELALQPDGKILAAGGQSLARYNPNGSLDTSFDVDGIQTNPAMRINALALAPAGQIVVAGSAAGAFAAARYNADGSLDTSFGNNGIATSPAGGQGSSANAVVAQPDGKVVLAGRTSRAATSSDVAIVRFDAAGALDASFSGDGIDVRDLGGVEQAEAVALQLDGKIVVAGHSSRAGSFDFALLRYLANGALDSSFSGDGVQTTDFGLSEFAYDLALQSDGKIVAVGERFSGSVQIIMGDFALARYNTDGELDASFSGDGRQITDFGGRDLAVGVAMAPDRKIVAAGATNEPSSENFAVARYQGAPSPAPAPSGGPSASPGSDAAVAPNLAGCPPARVARKLFTLSSASDTRSGSLLGDLIFAGTGNDVIDGLAGDDCIDLGPGSDRGTGGLGDDVVLGGLGDDSTRGASGDDRLRGDAGNDRLAGGSGKDSVFGDSGLDFLLGGSGNDRLHGQAGRDRISGTGGSDRINGGSGGDVIGGGAGSDRARGDAGNDRLNGGLGRDSLIGDSGDDRVSARDGRRDRVNCGSGGDRVIADRVDVIARNCERVRRAR